MYLGSRGYTAASVGDTAILVLEGRTQDSNEKLWRFDVASRKFASSPIRLKPSVNAKGLGRQAPSISHLLNDAGGKALVVDSQAVVSEVGVDLTLRVIAKLPDPPRAATSGCCPGAYQGWSVNAAAQDRSGRWWLVVNGDGLLLQRGAEFVRVDYKESLPSSANEVRRRNNINQLIPGLANDMVVLTDEGIGSIRLAVEPR
jgi:hypothetical protein